MLHVAGGLQTISMLHMHVILPWHCCRFEAGPRLVLTLTLANLKAIVRRLLSVVKKVCIADTDTGEA